MQILPIFNINDLQLACFMYSDTHGLLPFYFINMSQFNSCIHTHNTRQKDKIHQIVHKLNLRKFTVTIAGPLLRNALPTYLYILPNKKIFCNRYKQVAQLSQRRRFKSVEILSASAQLYEKSHLTRKIALSCGIKISPVGSLD